jgi:hypothetical protein
MKAHSPARSESNVIDRAALLNQLFATQRRKAADVLNSLEANAMSDAVQAEPDLVARSGPHSLPQFRGVPDQEIIRLWQVDERRRPQLDEEYRRRVADGVWGLA